MRSGIKFVNRCHENVFYVDNSKNVIDIRNDILYAIAQGLFPLLLRVRVGIAKAFVGLDFSNAWCLFFTF